MRKLRSMRPKAEDIWVNRGGAWQRSRAEEIVPGDLVAPISASGIIAADLLIINGSAQVDESILTGEATLQLKDSIQSKTGPFDLKKDKENILFGGTKLVKANGKGPGSMPTCYVLRTGWATTQGKLMRAVEFSTDRMTVNSWEAFLFIGILLLFAIAADVYVVYKAMDDPNRDKYKLLLKCIIILTSVVPPELPIELALAVNASIMALQQRQIFCTEPFRIQLAGKVDTVCLDKTGTLTDRDFEVKGFCSAGSDFRKCGGPTEQMVLVAVGCHSLIDHDGELVGDPIETAAFRESGFKLVNFEAIGNACRVSILQRFTFNADLRRMSCVVRVDSS
jgi:cation-transporting ATPase 13A1